MGHADQVDALRQGLEQGRDGLAHGTPCNIDVSLSASICRQRSDGFVV